MSDADDTKKLTLTPQRYAEIVALDMTYTRTVHAAGSFLDVPDVQGKAQIPILYSREDMAAVNKTVSDAYDRFATSVSDEEAKLYFAEKRRRKLEGLS